MLHLVEQSIINKLTQNSIGEKTPAKNIISFTFLCLYFSVMQTTTYPLRSLRKLDLLSNGYSTGTIWQTHSLVDEHGGHLCDNESWMSAYDYGIFEDAAIKDIQVVYGFSDDLCLQMYNEGMLVINLDAAGVWINYGDENSSSRKQAVINQISPVLDAHYHNQDLIEYSVRAKIFIDEDEYCDEEVDEEQWDG